MPQRTIHVRPLYDGTWAVELEHSRVLLSTHHDAREAIAVAESHAREHDAEIIVHDAYDRARAVPHHHDQVPSGHVPSSGVRD